MSLSDCPSLGQSAGYHTGLLAHPPTTPPWLSSLSLFNIRIVQAHITFGGPHNTLQQQTIQTIVALVETSILQVEKCQYA